MIADEFLSIAGPALRHHGGADSVTVTAVEPSPHGPLVRWNGPLLAVERERTADGSATFVGPVPGPFLLDLLARTLACRWRDGAPRCPPDWAERLARRHRRVFGQGCFECGPGWRWLWEAAAELLRERGIPDGFHSTQLKEKFGCIRWYYDANENCEYMKDIVDGVEHLSAYICEECGRAGRVRQGGWLRCLCPEHANGRRIAGGA
ncbi:MULTISPECIES: hypothetical protein [Methylobacteriaceae]|uniref:Uncharacterized protein n=2 Tax=Methylobacteriaceae TaxID=119045 RepID=A0AA37HV19_9HYPH|nr:MULTISPECIES: hypothetical protein [Methylobacteriaceae]MDQ0520116.1 hypothetical protein [Methylobacterium gregans]BAU90595.1 hypothetical protein MPPM_1990 [Methylorubrum populi]GJD81268.1 hypothetical protein NBEOAGPD_4514 [Methylobacterium gregans]GLS52520.1 hypothetical protein GCM10007886_07030 [Methylobacterium gregans]